MKNVMGYLGIATLLVSFSVSAGNLQGGGGGRTAGKVLEALAELNTKNPALKFDVVIDTDGKAYAVTQADRFVEIDPRLAGPLEGGGGPNDQSIRVTLDIPDMAKKITIQAVGILKMAPVSPGNLPAAISAFTPIDEKYGSVTELIITNTASFSVNGAEIKLK